MRRFADIRGSRVQGLLRLMKYRHREKFFEDMQPRLAEYDEHPLGLTLPEGFREGSSWQKVFMVHGLSSDMTVDAMVTCIQYFADRELDRLRVITVRHQDPMQERRYFFEAAFPHAVILGGDCTYFSGAGGTATRDMRGIFQVLASAYDHDIDEELLLPADLKNLDRDVLIKLGIDYFIR